MRIRGILEFVITLIVICRFTCIVYSQTSGNWIQMSPSVSPSPREQHAMAYDSKNGVVVLFGGRTRIDPDEYSNETWIYDVLSNTWTQKFPDVSPPAQFQHAMTYDSAHEVVVMYSVGETWTYDVATNTWTQKFPESRPTTNGLHAMTYDSVNEVVILFGGYNLVSDTWIYDSDANTWTQRFPAVHPSGRWRTAMAYDSDNQLVVLFGGYVHYHVWNDETWVYNAAINVWTEKTPAVKPLSRQGHSMVYDSASGNVILFGGEHSMIGEQWIGLNDTWMYNLPSNTWTEVPTEAKPAPRMYPSMVYDSKNEVIVLFGGNTGDALTNVLVNDTWIYRTYTAMPAFRVLKATISENWKTGGQKAKIMSTFQLGLSKNLTRGLTVTVGDYTETLLPPNLVEKNKTSWYYKRPRGQPKQGIKKLRIKWDKKGDITRDVVKMSILIDNAPIFPGGIPGGSNMNVDILISHGRERASEAIRMVQKRVGMLRYKVRK